MATGWEALNELVDAARANKLSAAGQAALKELQAAHQAGKLSGVPTEPSSTTTQTPTTRTFPQALGETAMATATRPIYAGQDYLAQGLAPHSFGAVGDLARTFFPFLAPAMTAGGMATETYQRMQPGTTEPQAEQAAGTGQLTTGVGQLLTEIPGAISGGMKAYRAARAPKAGPAALGQEIAQAGAKGAVKRLTARLGGAQDASTFAQKARPILRAQLGRIEAAGPSPAATSLRQLVGEGESLKPLTRAVRKDPAMVASYLQSAPELLPELQRSHMTELVTGATRKVGTQRGTLNIAKLVKPWNKLGDAGKAAIYGAKQAKAIDKLFANMATLVPSGEAAGKTVTAGAQIGQKIVTALEHGGLVAAGYELMRGKPGTAAVAAVSPFLAELLVRNGGPEWINAVVTASRDPAIWSRALPALGKIGMQIIAQPEPPRAPRPAAPPMPFGPPMAPPMAPPAPGLDSPEGIMAAIENTVLPPGWRPGQAPVMR